MNDQPHWFADHGTEEDDGYNPAYPWVPVLGADGCCFPLPVWFKTEPACFLFIQDTILKATGEQ